ncbi:hypothetical protein D3C71_1657410 [compost metagenome]
METFLIIFLYSKSTPALLVTLLVLALTLAVFEVVFDLEVVVVVLATAGLGSALVPTAIILSFVTVCTSLPIMRIEASSPSW